MSEGTFSQVRLISFFFFFFFFSLLKGPGFHKSPAGDVITNITLSIGTDRLLQAV